MTYAIRIRALEKRYPHFCLRVPALEVPMGSLLGVIGPNGAGKSTLLRILLGLVRPEEGRIEVLGHPYPEGEADARGDIGFLSEDLRLYGGESLEWHIGFVRSVSPRWDEAFAAELVGRLGLDLKKPAGKLSHGQRVKSALLLALARRPKLLVLDEPTTALDPAVRREVLSELMRVLEDEERTVVFSSHMTQDVERIADRVLFLGAGGILADEATPDLLERWRRIHVTAAPGWVPPEGFRLEAGPSAGRQSVLISGSWSGAQARRLEGAGASIVQIDRLTLEEIFLLHVGAPNREVVVG